MKPQLIEVTITSDSQDTLIEKRKGLIRPDQITTMVDISSGNFRGPTLTQITLEEEGDYVSDDDETGTVVRSRRTLCVTESYEEVKSLLNSAWQAASPD